MIMRKVNSLIKTCCPRAVIIKLIKDVIKHLPFDPDVSTFVVGFSCTSFSPRSY